MAHYNFNIDKQFVGMTLSTPSDDLNDQFQDLCKVFIERLKGYINVMDFKPSNALEFPPSGQWQDWSEVQNREIKLSSFKPMLKGLTQGELAGKFAVVLQESVQESMYKRNETMYLKDITVRSIALFAGYSDGVDTIHCKTELSFSFLLKSV